MRDKEEIQSTKHLPLRASIESKKERERQQQRIAYLYTPSGHKQEEQLK